ncbi:hypothetical protein B834_759 [Enterococcus mundtii 1A]|nr:hypothetical protein [Enterococcus mundtii 1A]
MTMTKTWVRKQEYLKRNDFQNSKYFMKGTNYAYQMVKN